MTTVISDALNAILIMNTSLFTHQTSLYLAWFKNLSLGSADVLFHILLLCFSRFSVFHVILCFWYCMLLLSFELYAIVSIVLAFILVCNLADVCDFNLAKMLICGYTLPFVAIWAFFTLNGLFQTGHHFATFSGVLIVWCVCCRISSQLCSLS